MKTRVPSKVRSQEHPLLFPGMTLNNKIHKVQYATQIVGDIFEKLTASLVGKQWKRLLPSSEMDVRPDLGTADGLNYIESKATQHRFKCVTHQIKHYKNLVSENAALRRNCNVVFFLWTYGDKTIRLVEHGKTTGGLIKLLMDNVASVHMLHWSIVDAMFKRLPTNVTFNSYDSWKVARESGKPFEVIQFGEPFLRRLRENPALTVYKELYLNPEHYDLQPNYKRVYGKSVEVDGTIFKSAPFDIHRFTPASNYVPFPEVLSVKDAIPF